MKILKQKMMIVWRWNNLEHINELSWEQPAFIKEDYINNIAAGEGEFYKEYNVEKSEYCPNAQLIAVSIYQTSRGQSSKNEALLNAVLNRYLPILNKKEDKEDAKDEFMLFLHRGNGYSEKDIDLILDKYEGRISKIFLFSNNRDIIYYGVRQKGLLDDDGGFFNGDDPYTENQITVCGTDKNGSAIIKQPYFDRIWLHYKIEFETKVFGLKEDLYKHWLPYLLPNRLEKIDLTKLLDAIKTPQEGTLFYRLKSFLDLYSDTEREQIKIAGKFKALDDFDDEKYLMSDYERRDRKSYFFDDCITNMEHMKKDGHTYINEEYKKIKKMMTNLFIKNSTGVVTKTELKTVMEDLNYLAKIIPGLMD